MKIFNILKARIKIWRHEKYVLKKLSYHEAGHLVFAYFLDIPCKHILIDYSKVDGIRFENDNLIVEFVSDSHVENILPDLIDRILNNSRQGINNVALNNSLTVDECWNLVKQYLVILLAGYESQHTFSANFVDKELEDFERYFAYNLTTLNPNEDTNKTIILLNNLTTDNNLKNQIVDQVKQTIRHYLNDEEVVKAINTISKELIKKKRIDGIKVREILEKIEFIRYTNNERSKLLDLLRIMPAANSEIENRYK